MDIQITRSGSKVSAKIIFNKEEWKNAQEKAFVRLAKTVQIKGFRPGTAPLNLAKKSVNPVKVFDEAANSLLQEAYSSVVKDNNLYVIAQPSVEYDKLTEDELEVTIKIPVAPEVKLGQYQGLRVNKEPILVTDDDVTVEIERLRNVNAQFEVKEEGQVENGNIAVIDFEGFIDGVAFEGGKGENFELEIGSGQFIPGFEEQLISLNKGETKSIDVVFPENYTPEFANKKATFVVKVNEIKVKVLPELDDNFALDVNKEGVKTFEQLKDELREEIRTRRSGEAEQTAVNVLIKNIVDSSTVESDPETIEKVAQENFEHFKQHGSNGLTYDQYLARYSTNDDAVLAEIKENVAEMMKLSLVFDRIAMENDISVNEKEVNEILEHYAKAYRISLTEAKKEFQARIYDDLFNRKVTEFLRQNNEIL